MRVGICPLFAFIFCSLTRQNDTYVRLSKPRRTIVQNLSSKDQALLHGHLQQQIGTLLTNPTAPNVALAKILMRIANSVGIQKANQTTN
jgi:hypothetical protein